MGLYSWFKEPLNWIHPRSIELKILMVTKVWRNVSGYGVSINVGCNLRVQKRLVDFVNARFSFTEWNSVFWHAKTFLNLKLEHFMKKNPSWNSQEVSKNRTTCIRLLGSSQHGMLLWPRPMSFLNLWKAILSCQGAKAIPDSFL